MRAEPRSSPPIIPAIFLGCRAFLLHIVLARLVATQRDQIGVLKAFGYANARVGLHYLELALVHRARSGSLLGSALGIWLAPRLTGIYQRILPLPGPAPSAGR